jgi:chromosome segregation protein
LSETSGREYTKKILEIFQYGITMRIEKIELIGFKSFAEKTAFQLHPGITCIVGPNGAGKSNIVDSFRWVLGEQSAKSLRGEKMEEVIFNGSATKKPRGMSEVNLLLSFDSPEQGNGDARDLTMVARRLYRSGESEYLINRTQCRLRDIKDLFLDTGLEIKSYSILEQGRIGEILNSKPQDRRFLIEEVAGVMKYKARKTEALSKLESSRLNLQRINDIVAEVRRQINSLDRQVRKAERYKKLSAEMRSIELKIAGRDYAALRESLDAILARHTSLKEEDTVIRAELNKIENAIETKRLGLLDKEKFVEEIASELQGQEKEIADTERLIAVSTTESTSLTEYLAKLTQQESDIAHGIALTEGRKMELQSLEMNLASEMDNLRQELAAKNDAVRDLESELFEKDGFIDSKRREIFRIAEEISHLRNETGRLLTSMENLERKHAATDRESDAAKEHLARVETGLKDIAGSLAGRNNELLLLNEQKGVLAADIEGYLAKLEESRNRMSETREELASASSRLLSLKEILHEDLSREVLTEHLHIVGSIAEIIEVDEEYERAVENALSGKVNGFIVQSFEDISRESPALKEKGIRRTTFIPLNAPPLEPNEISETGESSGHDSLLGRACDLVRFHPDNNALSSLLKGLLNNVLVVKDLSAAFSLLSKFSSAGRSGFTFATLDGETVEPSGAVTVGEGKGILRRKRETRELEALIDRKKAGMERLSESISALEGSLQERQASLKDIETAVINAEREISLLRLTSENQNEEKERISRKLAYLTIEGEEILRERDSLKAAVSDKEAEVAKMTAKKEEAEQFISTLQEEIARSKERFEAERASITDLRLSLNSCKERTDSLHKEMETSFETLSDLSGKLETLAKEKSGMVSRMGQCREEIERNNDKLRELVLKADSLKTVIGENREILRSESEDLIRSEQESKALRSRLDSLSVAINETGVAIAEHRLKIENLSGSVSRNYGIEIDSFDSEPAAVEDEERLSELRTKIQELGPVNLGTLEEYEELKTRYEFLTKQQDDLNKSIAELEEAITKINSTTRRKLREAYEQLNAKFSEVFIFLFGGGKAGLVMTDENNILDSGIDIVVQPPGKKLQNITLLSGGEKALTALALLFASFLIKPSPLCILDEVDAALDESNIARFARMVRELSGNIQFIVVTHNRATMEAADYIYGITMEEPGVSKVISMQLVES